MIRKTLAASGLAAAILLQPGTAFAHAAFVSSQPAPGASLSATPGIVVLDFTEPLNRKLSLATVVDPTGRRFGSDPAGEREIRVPLSTNTPGVYTVSWRTVSTVDGHTLRGTFRFGVGVAAGPGSASAVGAAPAAADLLIAVARWVEYLGLLAAVGVLLMRRIARREPSLPWVRVRLRLPLGLALLGGIAVVVGEGLAASPTGLSGVGTYLTTGLPGVARLLRIVFESLAFAAALMRRGPAAFFVTAALFATAAAGHAAAVRPSGLGIAVDGLHLTAAGLWAGGLLALAMIRPPHGWRGPDGLSLLQRFSPVALPAFVATMAFGTVRGFQELGRLGDLVGSSYGRVLTAKVVGVLAMLPLSILAWRRLARSPRAEATLAIAVVALAALLASYPLPPGRAGEAEEATSAGSSPGIPRAGDLTMGETAGRVIIGLTVRPATPGSNDIYLLLVPPGGPESAGGLPVEMRLDDAPVALRPCGTACRRADLTLRGGERVEVRVAHLTGGSAMFEIPGLPPPDASELLGRARTRMHDLRTLRVEELLRGTPSIVNEYTFQAPDRWRIAQRGSFEHVAIGRRQYSRGGPGEPWRTSSGKQPAKVPYFVFDGFEAVAPRMIGTADLDGTRTTILSFATPDPETPIWFRLWADPSGLVLRGEMRAQNHVMSLKYFDFDAPLRIDPPVP